MRKRGICVFLQILALCFVSVIGEANDYFMKDSRAVYDNDSYRNECVIEIPGFKLDLQSALKIKIGKEEKNNAQGVDPRILKKAKAYIKHAKLSKDGSYKIYAAKVLGDYILLYFDEPNVMDGGFEIIYSSKLERIIGYFVAGMRG